MRGSAEPEGKKEREGGSERQKRDEREESGREGDKRKRQREMDFNNR